MLVEIINNCLNEIELDILSLKYLGGIDFFDFFPKSKQHKLDLETEAAKVAQIIDKSERGNFYRFDKPVKTKFGEIEIFKIR